MKNIEQMDQLKKYRVLYVEDNQETLEEIAFFLESRVKNLYLAANGEEGRKAFLEYSPDIIISDIQMPVMDGLEMIKLIRESNSDVPIVVTTAFNEANYLVKAINLQVDGYLMKPLNLKELMSRLYKITEPMELQRALVSKNEELEYINANLDSIAQEKTKELEYLYSHDPLTGLSNSLKLRQEIEMKDYKNLILLDISNFSIINKQYGKVFANAILKSSADALRDNITPMMKLFKTESDTFVILTKEEKESNIESFCQQIISYFDTKTLSYDDVELKVNFSIGIAPVTNDEHPMVNAEYALEIGKEIGSRYYNFYDDNKESLKKAKDAINWLNITKQLIEEDKIEPYFQPIVNFKTGEVVKFEVLARGDYNGELLSPYRFIHPAERLGLINSITRIMINKSFSFFNGTDYKFSINLTQRDLLDNYITSFLEQKLALYDVKAESVTFEILENITLNNNQDVIITQIQKLQAIGFKIAVDDFGVENSCLNRLLEVDYDYIKLDGTLIKNLLENKKDRLVLDAMVKLSNSLGIKTIAEFVENKELYELLKESGVDVAQGYFIQKPCSRNEFPGLLSNEIVFS